MPLNQIESDFLEKLHCLVQNNELSNECLVQIIEQCGTYLNLQTISDYAKINNLSYNGVKKCRNVVNIFNVKFVIDNS
jgi:hypothetical protein